MDECADLFPFGSPVRNIHAALTRNPVSVQGFAAATIEEVSTTIQGWPDTSVYDENRVAQPDEVYNFQRGDGFEKALLIANLATARNPESPITLKIAGALATVSHLGGTISFPMTRKLTPVHVRCSWNAGIFTYHETTA